MSSFAYIIMAEPTLKHRLVDFNGLPCSNEEEKQCHKQAFNSFMLRISDLEKYSEVEEFTECCACKMILTDQDKDYIDDWSWVSENKEQYADLKQKFQIMEKNPWRYYVWNCRFCGTKNLLEKSSVRFTKNKSKVIIKDEMPKDLRNSYCDDPLLLFLIDNSSSMEEDIIDLNDPKKWTKELQTMVKDVLKKTKIYSKIVEDEQRKLKDIKKLYPSNEQIKPEEYTDYLSKYKVLMSLTQSTVMDICDNSSTAEALQLFSSKAESSKSVERRIGFMFFNSSVTLQKISKQETKVITVEDKAFQNDYSDSETMLKVNFNSFQQLFELGRKNGANYGMEIKSFNFSQIKLNMSNPSGQTALGPALTIAAGIVSDYGPGSVIVIITDGKANKGIFSEEGIYEEELKFLKIRLDKAKAETCLIQLDKKHEGKKNEGDKEMETSLQRFFRKYSQKINICLDSKESPLESLKKKLRSIVNCSVNGNTWANDIRIKCQNSNVDYEGCVKKMKTKLFSTDQAEYFSPKIDESKLKQYDYWHPFMTQIIVSYTSINTKKSEKFMAYMILKLVKYQEMNKKDQESFESQETLQNVLKYLANEGEKLDLNNIPLTLTQISFRSEIEKSMDMSVDRARKMNVMKDKFIDEIESHGQHKTVKDMIRQYQVVSEDYNMDEGNL